MMETTELKVVIFKGMSKWVAQCLERDIATQAERLEDLPGRLLLALDAEVKFSEMRNQEPFERLPEAPARYWAMWRGACDLGGDRWSDVPAYILPKIADERSAVL